MTEVYWAELGWATESLSDGSVNSGLSIRQKRMRSWQFCPCVWKKRGRCVWSCPAVRSYFYLCWGTSVVPESVPGSALSRQAPETSRLLIFQEEVEIYFLILFCLGASLDTAQEFLCSATRNHSWWCLGDQTGCQELSPAEPCARQTTYLVVGAAPILRNLNFYLKPNF